MNAMDDTSNLYECFLHAATRHGERIALVQDSATMSYAELAALARRIAANLALLGVGPESLVGLCGERSLHLIGALLGILGAGGAYLPLDPEYPESRLDYLVADARPSLVIVVGEIRPSILELLRSRARCVTMDELQQPHPGAVLERALADNLAYVIYTSGSTGGPKGNLITHRNVLRLFAASQPSFEFSERDVWPLLHSFAFDFSVWEIFGALLHGGRLVIADAASIRDPARLFELLVSHAVTVLNQTPSFFRLLCQHVASLAPAVRQRLQLAFIVFGGERLDFAFLQQWYAAMGTDTVLVNMYGITETTVHVTLHAIDPAPVQQASGSIIGAALPHLRLQLLDEAQQPVPAGVVGELYVEGDGLARGYHRRPARTAEVFVPSANPQRPGARLYRTGDLARVDGSGQLVYLGRSGGFVKVRGFRVSLAEVEAGLRQCRGIVDAVVLPREDEADVQLDAWLLINGVAPRLQGLRSQLEAVLPKFMVPHRFFRIAALPLTVHGKIDAAALRSAGERLLDEQRAGALASDAERAMLAVWAQVLSLPALGVEDDFFAAGGDSMKAVGLVVALGKAGWQVTVQDLIQAGHVRALCAKAASLDAAAPSYEPALSKAASDMQRQMLLQYARHAAHHNGIYHVQQSFRLTVPGLDLARLVGCFEAECAANASCCTSFAATEGGFSRVLHTQPLLRIEQLDWSRHDAQKLQQCLLQYAADDVRQPFDLTNATAPTKRIALMRLDATSVRVFLSTHHAIDDGWGQQQFLSRVLSAYERDELPSVQTASDPFDAYVARQQQVARDPAARRWWSARAMIAECLVHGERPVPPQVIEVSRLLAPARMAEARRTAREARVSAKALHVAQVARAIATWMQLEAVTLGVVVNGRHAELAAALTATGLYWNLQPFTCSVTDTLQSVHDRLLQQEQFALYPLGQIMAEHCPGMDLKLSFNYTNFPPAEPTGSALRTDQWTGLDTFHYPINIGLHCDEANEEYVLRVVFDPACCSVDRARALLDLVESGDFVCHEPLPQALRNVV